jgi:hypothetical protein
MRPTAMRAITMFGSDTSPDKALCKQRLSILLRGGQMSVSSVHLVPGDAGLMMNSLDQQASSVVHSTEIWTLLDVKQFPPPPPGRYIYL